MLSSSSSSTSLAGGKEEEEEEGWRTRAGVFGSSSLLFSFSLSPSLSFVAFFSLFFSCNNSSGSCLGLVGSEGCCGRFSMESIRGAFTRVKETLLLSSVLSAGRGFVYFSGVPEQP